MKYISKYTDKKVSFANHAAEILCERKAARNNSSLPAKFWNLPEWSSFYRYQLNAINALLRRYNSKTILQAINKVKWAYSVRAEAVVAELDKLSKLYGKDEDLKQKEVHVSLGKRRDFKKKSILEILDGQKEEN